MASRTQPELFVLEISKAIEDGDAKQHLLQNHSLVELHSQSIIFCLR